MDPNDTQVAGTTDPAEDTSVTQSDATGEVATEAPEATQGTEAQGASTTEVNAEDTAETKLYAGKYKTVEDMEKAYQELNSKFTNTTQEKAELSRILNEAFVTPTTDEAETATEQFVESDPLATEVSNLKRMTAVQTFIISHPEADPAVMQKVLTEDPLVKQINGHEAKLEYAFIKSKSMGTDKAIETARKEAQVQTQVKVVEKQAAQVESASRTEKVDENTELHTKATGNYSYKEREAARIALLKKQLTNI